MIQSALLGLVGLCFLFAGACAKPITTLSRPFSNQADEAELLVSMTTTSEMWVALSRFRLDSDKHENHF